MSKVTAKNIQISAPLSTAHVVSVSFDSTKGFLVATQKANGNLGRKRALRDRTRSGIAGVRDFILSKFCEKCKLRPVAARVLIGDKTLEYCKPCALEEQAEYERRLARWQEAQAKKAAAAAAAAAAALAAQPAPAVDPMVELRNIETRYRTLMQCDIGGELPFDALPTHFARLQSIGEPGRWNGVDMEFRYITLLSMLAQQPAVTFGLEQNKLKNRYLNVIAPDHSLVPLHYPGGPAPVSAYINANYCDSLLPSRTGLRRYIATQGPLPDTVGDFWLMCWQENVSVIAMLTLCVEKDKLKCEQYWPEANSDFVDAESLYGVMNVRLLQRGGNSHIIERRFLITNTIEKRSRELVHFLFTEWPDYGCPDSADSFLRLIDAVDEANVSASSMVIHCVPEQHEILTERGFMDLDTYKAATADGSVLRVAGYNPTTKQLLFETPRRLVENDRAEQMLVEFSSVGAWSDDADDYGRVGKQQQTLVDASSDHMSLLVTPGHQMFVQTKGVENYRKVVAKELLEAAVQDVRHLAVAEAGFAGTGDATPPPYMSALDLATAEQEDAWLELYGFWLGNGNVDCSQIVFSQPDVAFLMDAIERVGLVRDTDWSQTATTVTIVKHSWLAFFCAAKTNRFASWIWTLDCERLRVVIRGLWRADSSWAAQDKQIVTSSTLFRDEIVRVLLMAGYSARFDVGANDMWSVQFAETCAPTTSKARGEVRECAYTGRTWCFEMPSGFIMTRRAHKNADGVVTKASRPIVVGNCSAGIGRTGTFCAVHAALEKYRYERAQLSAPQSTTPRTARGATDAQTLNQSGGRAPPPTPFKSRSPVDVLNESMREQKAAALPVTSAAGAGDALGVPPSDRSEMAPTPPAPAQFESRDGTRPGYVSLVRIVAHLRGGRPAMVQTKEQLEFAYGALVTALEREAAVPATRVGTLRGGAKRMPPLRARTFLDPWRGDAALYVDTSKSHTRAGVAWSRIASASLALPTADGPAPTPTISQGALGDAWFLGALATIATRPELLGGMSYNHERAEFRCRFFKDGAWRTVLVDDRVPCFAESNVPVFACATLPRDNWVALIEKAYAKLHGCYQSLEGGTLLQGMVDLTGGAPERIDVAPDGDRDSLWARLIDAESHRWPVALLRTAAVAGSGEAELESAVLANRAYPFVRTAQRSGERFVVLRNPWFSEADDETSEPLPVPPSAPRSEPLPRASGRFERDVLVAAGLSDDDPDAAYAAASSSSTSASASAAAAAATTDDNEDGDDCLLVLTLDKLCKLFDRVFLCRTHDSGDWDDAVDGEFSIAAGTAGGSPKHASWRSNARFIVRVPPQCSEVFVVMSQPDSRPWHVDGKISSVLSQASQAAAAPPATAAAVASSSSSPSSPTGTLRSASEVSAFTVATAAAFAANVAAGDVPGMPRFSIGMHALRCGSGGEVDATFGRDATLARTAYSKVREVGMSLVLPPSMFVLVPATSRPDSETPFRVAVYGEGVTIEHVPSTAAPQRAIEGEWRGTTAGGSFMHVSWCDNPQYSFALQERMRVRVTLEQLVGDGEAPVPIGFVLLLGTRRRRAVSLPSLTPSVQRDEATPTTVRILTDAAVAAMAKTLASLPVAPVAIEAGGGDDALSSLSAPVQAPIGAVLAVAGFNARRSVSVDVDIKPARLLPPDERFANIVIVPSTYDPGVERRFRVVLEAHPSPPKLTPCVVWPTEARVVGEWSEHSAGGGASTALWRANVQYRIVGVSKPCAARLVLRRIDAATAAALESDYDDWVDAPVTTSRRYDAKAKGSAPLHMGVHVLRGSADAPADELHAETEVARSNFEAANEVSVVAYLTPLPRSQAFYVMPCTYRPDTLGHYVLTLFADEPGLTIEPADRTFRGLLRGEWTAARSGGCANSDDWVQNPHVRVQFDRERKVASGTVRVLLVPDRELASRGTGFYTTPRVPSTCTIADIWRLADVKFVVGDHVAMTFYNIPFDRDMYIVPCTFEPGVLGKFALFVRADAPFELVDETAELPPMPDPLLE